MKLYIATLCLLAITAGAQQPTGSQQPPAGGQRPAAKGPMLVGNGPPQAPADPRMISTWADIQAKIALDDANVAAGKQTDGTPIVMQGPYRATMEWRNTAQKSINVHQTDAEIFVIIEGSGAMLLGGTLVDPKQAHTFAWEGPTLTANKVEGATEYKVVKGDTIMIPPGTPHTVSKVDGKLVLWSMHLPMPPSTPASQLTPMPTQPQPVAAPATPTPSAGPGAPAR